MVDTKLKKPKIAVYDSDAPVTLKQGQGPSDDMTW